MPTPLRNPVAQTFSLLFRRLSVGKPWKTEVLSSLDPAQSQSPGRSEDLRYSRQESLRFVPAVWLALFVAFSVAGSALAGNVKTGDAFPDLAGFKLEGKLPDSTKGKVVLVDFWASWCEPCKQSFPVMEELHKRYAERGLVIVAVNVDENRADMEAFLKKNAASFTVMRDAGQKLVEKTGIATMPSSFLLDRDGKVRFAHTGFRGAETKKKYEEEIESLLK